MTNADKFLASYKEYEQLLRDIGLDTKAREDQADGSVQERLRICRQMRNYMTHTPDPGFLEPTDKMLRFLQGEVEKLKLDGDPVRKHLKKPEACILDYKAKVSDALAMFQKLKRTELLCRQESGGWNMVSIFDIIGLRSTCRLSMLKLKAIRPKFAGPLERFDKIDPDDTWICTDDGTPDGKILGQVWTR